MNIIEKYENLKEDLNKLEKDSEEVISSQLTELAKKEKISEMPKLKETLTNEQHSLEEASKMFTKMAAKSLESADEIKTQVKEFTKYEKKINKGKKLVNKPNAILDYKEETSNHFTSESPFYKLFWIFFIGSFAGVILETLYCYIQRGHFESRVGLVWGPFNLVYGLGALVLSICLYKYRNRSKIYSFLGGFITGSVIEYLCSWIQELVFGSTSWDYSNIPFNLNGRICLLYSFFWGILGIFWIKDIYPRLSEVILKIPNKIGKNLTIVLLIFMIIDSCVSGLAVFRWSKRVEGKLASNKIEEVLDDVYPNETMEKIYANLEFK